MNEDDGPIGELFMLRVALGQRIAALNATRFARQREGFGAEIILLDRQRSAPDVPMSANEGQQTETGRQANEAQAAIAAIDIELGALEAEVMTIDRQIAERQRGR